MRGRTELLAAVLLTASGGVALTGCGGTVSVSVEMSLAPEACLGFTAETACFSYPAWVFVTVRDVADDRLIDSRCISVPAEPGRTLADLPEILNDEGGMPIEARGGVEAELGITVFREDAGCPPEDPSAARLIGVAGTSDPVELKGTSISVPISMGCPNALCSNECGNAPAFVGAVPLLGGPPGNPLPGPMGITFSGDSVWIGFAAQAGTLIRVPPGDLSILTVPGLGLTEGIAPDGDGGIWIADVTNSGLVHRSASGESTEVASGMLPTPRGVVLGTDGIPAVAVADAVVAVIGGLPVERIGISGAVGLSLDLTGLELIVTAPPVVQRFDISGMTAVPVGEQLLGVPTATGLAVDVCNRIYVAEPAVPTIIRFDADDPLSAVGLTADIQDPAYLTFAVGPGFDPALLWVTSPADGIVYVMDVGIPGVAP